MHKTYTNKYYPNKHSGKNIPDSDPCGRTCVSMENIYHSNVINETIKNKNLFIKYGLRSLFSAKRKSIFILYIDISIYFSLFLFLSLLFVEKLSLQFNLKHILLLIQSVAHCITK